MWLQASQGAARCPQAQPEGRRGRQPRPPRNTTASFPLSDPRSIQSLRNKGLKPSHAGSGSREFPKAAKPQRPNKNSSSPINHTHPINHSLLINPTPAAGSCEGWRRESRTEPLGFGHLCSCAAGEQKAPNEGFYRNARQSSAKAGLITGT